MAYKAVLRKRQDGEIRSTKTPAGLYLLMVTRGERWQIVAANERTRKSRVLDAGTRNTASEVGTLIRSMQNMCDTYGVEWIGPMGMGAMTA